MGATSEQLIRDGYAARRAGRSAEALALYRSAVAVLRDGNDPLRLAHTVRHVGDILRETGHAAEALPCYEEALATYRGNSATKPLDLANTVAGYARAQEDLGHAAAARTLWQEARDLYASLDLQVGVDEANGRLSPSALDP